MDQREGKGREGRGSVSGKPYRKIELITREEIWGTILKAFVINARAFTSSLYMLSGACGTIDASSLSVVSYTNSLPFFLILSFDSFPTIEDL